MSLFTPTQRFAIFGTLGPAEPPGGLPLPADAIVTAGVRRVEGNLIADESYFAGNPIPLTWEWEDLQWDDGAEISAFPINNNAVDLKVSGTRSGQPCSVSILPPNTVYQVTNLCTTGGSSRAIVVKKALERNAIIVSGTMPANEGWTGYPTVTHPAELFITLLKERLATKGMVVTGVARVLPKPPRKPPATTTPPFSATPGEIARLE